MMKRHLDDVWEFRVMLNSESDRGCALMAAAYLDAQLDNLLHMFMVDDASVTDELLRVAGPLGAFAVRIDLAYGLGLIGSIARKDLHLIRKIRNEFGHVHTPLSFGTPAIANRCRELYYTHRETHEKPRDRFTDCVLGVVAGIHARTHRTRHAAVPPDMDVTPAVRASIRQLAKALLDSAQK